MAKDNGDNANTLRVNVNKGSRLKRQLPYGPLLTHEAVEFVEQIGHAYSLGPTIRHKLTLIVEELVTNSVNYGKMAADGHVELDVEVKDDAACLRYCDTGIAFDPVSNAPDDDRQLAARERRVGGLGWPLIKDLSTDLEYQRLDGQNQITLKLLL
ncbi:MAG: ATP-binding protein [Alphaproteobacteria bacterium]|nr:ATP-binding protein [Alphaproteobacteria bacterium]